MTSEIECIHTQFIAGYYCHYIIKYWKTVTILLIGNIAGVKLKYYKKRL